MSEVVSLQLPDETIERFRRGAAAAGKSLEEFLSDRLADAIPFVPDELPRPLQNELRAIEALDDTELWQITRLRLRDEMQMEYDRLLSAQADGPLSGDQQKALEAIGEQARLLSLKKSHAWMLLKWRGHDLPQRDDLREVK